MLTIPCIYILTHYCINRPVLLKTTDPSDLVVLLLGNQRETSQISLGAHQVVIVRDDDARRTLPDELKVITLYTIYYVHTHFTDHQYTLSSLYAYYYLIYDSCIRTYRCCISVHIGAAVYRACRAVVNTLLLVLYTVALHI
jgi:hypothetical protein